ncbi:MULTISPECIES: sigma-54-dependent Fis family transcriptional regulator [unclassified Oceanobacter]|uniref:sigma-54-dependent Fis family transcriptional regulator n=1 Tax=unclassified Oceanobacter TaxID=2620260 RepID=UPI0027360FBB|nr:MULTISPECIES: sigma-54-dependent Fis family transcriptional regulator [unclassified Oceanobacter]MDP2609188.1 sigma 54-interacting transcriptional regulator [Oceanobacter sp. 1_MG-2023]MDP2612520.1 sigma 54-interacting transcriptional regulator [Oceanobacter sp. 2_MG-2023]
MSQAAMSHRTPLPTPSDDDLIHQLRFDPDSGHIWLHENRMLLTHAAVFGQLRKDLIDILGWERAKGVLMRFGYASGRLDAELAKRLRPDLSTQDSFVVGPQLHKLEGKVKVTPIRLEFDMASGAYYGEFDWHHSWEAEQHLQEIGPSKEAVCWTLLGYASGYTSYYMGRQILFKETQCCACGDSHCVNIGRPAHEWPDREALEKYLRPSPLIDELELLQHEYTELKSRYEAQAQADWTPFSAVGNSPAFKQACDMISRAAASKVSVLLLGETGVGKEVQARNIHRLSDRAEQPFVAVNCACIPPDLIESELFGVEKGAFTGAHQSRKGKFERADYGTIFLDEVAELTPRAQATLLRVLQEGELERVGDTMTRKIDVRVVAATNEDLQQAVQGGRFRADLFFRLNVLPIRIPPLRERREDIPLLVEHFLDRYQREYNKKIIGLTDRAMSMLADYSWPGNVRELENMIERGVILTDNHRVIELEHLFPSLTEPTHPLNIINHQGKITSPEGDASNLIPGLSTDQLADILISSGTSLDELETLMIDKALKNSEGVVTEAAKQLGLTRPALAYRMKKRQ